jgi:hypothetical protein
MFAIHDIEGRRFRDALGSLSQVRETQASHGMQFHSNVSEVDA